MRRLVALSIGCLAVMSGCSGARHHVVLPTTTTLPDPDVVPAVITPAYVDAVFVALNHVYGNASRTLRADHAVTPAARADLRAIFGDPAYGAQLQAAQQAVDQGVINNIRPNAGDLVTTVTRLVTALPTCIFVEATTNFSAVQVKPTPTPASEFFQFAPKQARNDPEHINPTPWEIAVDDAYLKPTTVRTTCPT